jgi:hypothetical protein
MSTNRPYWERKQLAELAELKIVNDPDRAGQLASEKVLFCGSRYAIAAVHSRFAEDGVTWFVWDAEQLDENDDPTVIRQAGSVGTAIQGLD